MEKELRVLHLDLQATGNKLCAILSIACTKDLKAHPHSDILSPIQPHFLTVPFLLGIIFFQTTTKMVLSIAGNIGTPLTKSSKNMQLLLTVLVFALFCISDI